MSRYNVTNYGEMPALGNAMVNGHYENVDILVNVALKERWQLLVKIM